MGAGGRRGWCGAAAASGHGAGARHGMPTAAHAIFFALFFSVVIRTVAKSDDD